MSTAAFLLEIILASVVIVSISAARCISCPCGPSNQNYTHCIGDSELKNFSCERWSHCQTCRANITFCLTCPPDRFGPFCSKISVEHIRRKRQDNPNLLNYPRQSGSCPYLERPDSGSIRCSTIGNDRSCTARCLPGYHFEGEENVNEINLRCRGGVWTPRRDFPACVSGGYCEVRVTGAGFYNCTIDMEGTHCDITCEGFYRGRFHCYPGRQWTPPLPPCTVPKERESCLCQNGGICDENGICICPEGRAGTYCENLERQRATCQDPGIPMDGRRLNSDGGDASYLRTFEEGESVIFSCNGDGFALQGSSFVTCRADGTWSANRPRCVRVPVGGMQPPSGISCRHPGVDVNGVIEAHPLLDPQRRGQTFPPDTELNFLCNEGFEVEGPTTLTCQRSGEWSSAPPTCRRIIITTVERPASTGVCRHPGVDVNGRIEDEPLDPRERRRMFPVDTPLTFTCNDGFVPEGPTVIYCLNNGEWSSVAPSCRRAVREPSELTQQCPAPRLDPNIEIEEYFLLDPRKLQRFEPGQELTFTCRAGYDLEGSNTIQCLRNGQWSSSSPTCRSNYRNPAANVNCPAPEVDPNAIVEEFLLDPRKLTSFEPDTQLTFRCQNDYVLEGWSTITCSKNGQWSSPSPKCNIKPDSVARCLNPGPISNGNVYVFRPADDTIQPDFNGEDDFPFETHLVYTCEDGFVLEGDESITCESNSYWSGSAPICKEVASPPPSETSCRHPGVDANGVIEAHPLLSPQTRGQSFPPDTELKFACKEGYQPEGPTTLICERSGEWSSAPPICRSITTTTTTTTTTEDCGRSIISNTDRVTFGNLTAAGEWPWTVAIAETGGRTPEIICGGALLDRRTVLTASHCLTSATSFLLYFGKHNSSVRYDDREVQVRRSSRIILHPDFNEETFDNDVAIVKFQPDVRYSDRVQPICLPTRISTGKNVVTGKRGYVTGWGINEDQVQSDQLMMAFLPIQSDQTCLEAYNKRNLYPRLNAGKFCAGNPKGVQSTCRGDSGSPLVFYDRDSHRHTIEGIASFGITGECSDPEKYTVFAKVSEYMNWILQNLRN